MNSKFEITKWIQDCCEVDKKMHGKKIYQYYYHNTEWSVLA